MHRLSLSGFFFSAALALALPVAANASGRPSIAVGAPANGSIIHGTSLTVHFQVRNFTLAPVGGQAPKHGAGYAGHIQARLDGFPINPATDLTASITHTWQHVPAGPHVLTVWLANTMNVPIPGVAPAKIAFTMRPLAPVKTPPVYHASSPGVGAAPRTGGADGATAPELNHNLVLIALLALFLGATLFSVRRLSFGIAGRHSRAEASLDPSVAFPAQNGTVLDTLPLSSSHSASDAHTGATVSRDSVMSFDVISGSQGASPDPQRGSTIDFEPDPIAVSAQHELTVTGSSLDTVVFPGDSSLVETVEAARRWPEIVQKLAQRVEQSEEERRRLQEQIATLEQAARDSRQLRLGLYATDANPLDAADLGAVRFVADELIRDPDHIVTLAAVSQHASQVHQIVEEYARLHEVLYGQTEI